MCSRNGFLDRKECHTRWPNAFPWRVLASQIQQLVLLYINSRPPPFPSVNWFHVIPLATIQCNGMNHVSHISLSINKQSCQLWQFITLSQIMLNEKQISCNRLSRTSSLSKDSFPEFSAVVYLTSARTVLQPCTKASKSLCLGGTTISAILNPCCKYSQLTFLK